MTTSTDFTTEEWKVLYQTPVAVAANSMMIGPASMLKAMKNMFTLILPVYEASKQFPDNELIQEALMSLRKYKENGGDVEARRLTFDGQTHNGKESALPDRNAWSERAITILSQRSQPQELNEYKRWLLLIASDIMAKVKSDGFLGLRKEAAQAELAQAIKDFAQVLQLAE